jgi:PAS domain S-box-containing protein
MEGRSPYQWLIEKDHPRMLLIAALTAVILFVNFFGFIVGITIVLSHLFYIPIVLASYWYPRRGLHFSIVLACLYLAASFFLTQPDLPTVSAAVLRAVMFIVVGGVVAYLARSLREQEELYQRLFSHSQAGTLLIRAQGNEGTIEEANPRAAELVGKEIAMLAGAPLAKYWQDGAERDRFFAGLYKDGAVHDAEAAFVKEGGQPMEVLISGSRLSGDRIILTIEDITERKHMEDALQSANAKLNTLSGITRHDLLNAMTLLAGQIDLGKMEHGSGPLAALFEKLERGVRLLQRRIEQTRDYQDLGARPADWQYVQGAVLSAASRIDFGKVTLRVWAERLEVYADPMIGTAFHHILENTVRHAGGAGWVMVTYHVTDGGCDLILEDNGSGIPPEKKEAIFSYRPGERAGLGLFLVREILGVTGLSIREEGVPGKGARFVIRVPADKYRTV